MSAGSMSGGSSPGNALDISVSHKLTHDRVVVTITAALNEFISDALFKDLITRMVNQAVMNFAQQYVADHQDELRKAFAHARIEKLIAGAVSDICVDSEIERLVRQRVNNYLGKAAAGQLGQLDAKSDLSNRYEALERFIEAKERAMKRDAQQQYHTETLPLMPKKTP